MVLADPMAMGPAEVVSVKCMFIERPASGLKAATTVVTPFSLFLGQRVCHFFVGRGERGDKDLEHEGQTCGRQLL